MKKILSIENLRVSFPSKDGKVRAARGVTFDIFEGETLALVGESGSGKSVTGKTLMGILPPSACVESGKIIFEDKDLTKLKEKEWRSIRGKKIAMVFQDATACLNPIVKVGKQIVEGILSSGKQSKADAKNLALKLMKEVGIENAQERFYQYPFEFSGGMRQRIVIAIALALNPDVLICDEPTTALDVTIQSQILELIKRLKKERNLSVLFITHDLGVVASMADRVAVMYAGKIVEYGNVREIFYQPKHPYTWALLSSSPDLATKGKLETIGGAPPVLTEEIQGDAFAPRNPYALNIDFEEEPPFFQVSPTHFAATWLLDERAPKVDLPDILKERIERMRREK